MPRRSRRIFLLATCLTAAIPAAATQIVTSGSINLGAQNGTLNYQKIINSLTCSVRGKQTYSYTQTLYDEFVFIPFGATQVPIAGGYTINTGGPGKITGSTCPNNGVLPPGEAPPKPLLEKNYQVYIYPNASGTAATNINAAYAPGIFGYINPKYIIATVLYAPPGSKSTAVYTNSTTVSSTTSISKTFTSSSTVSDSTSVLSGIPQLVPVPAFINGTETNSSSTTVMQQSQTSDSITLTTSTTNGLTIPGPANDYVGVDHDYDVIRVWINPVLPFTVYATTLPGETQIGWWGYGSSALDPTAPIDIWPIQVGCLNGDFPQTESACATPLQQFQRTWAANENWPSGQGPGLTQADLNNILAADPWGTCTPSDPIGSTACPTYSIPGFTLPNFALSDQSSIAYTQPLPGGQPQPQSYGVSTTNAETNTSVLTTGYSQTFGYEIAESGTGFLSGFSSKLDFSQTLSWSYAYSVSLSTTNTKSGTANITPPACAGNPCNPSYPPAAPTFGTAAAFDIFIDGRFGTFAFLPSAY